MQLGHMVGKGFLNGSCDRTRIIPHAMPSAARREHRRKKGTCTLVATSSDITTDANEMMAPLHDRMPMLREPQDWPTG